jgi:hypothetical protein
LINSQFGPIVDIQLISNLFLTLDLLDLCLANNLSTEFTFNPHDTLSKFIKKIEKRLFNNGHIR